MARPRKEIDKRQFESLCELQCTQDEMLAVFGVTDKTLNAWCRRTYGKGFSEVVKMKREVGKTSLRRYQMNLAKKNAVMAIWLGKNYLGQRDIPEDSIDQEDTAAYLGEAGLDVKK